MGFDRFGLKSFVSETKVEDFVTYLEQGKMMTTRCKKCSGVTFPPRIDCISCESSEMEWIEIKEAGKLVTFTTVMYGPAGFENQTPYTLGVVQFSQGIKMLGQIDKKIPIGEIKVGMEMNVVPIELSQNRFSYQFEKA
jgi:uncharacterized OB-fold protein